MNKKNIKGGSDNPTIIRKMFEIETQRKSKTKVTMNESPKLPQEFVVMSTPFTDNDIENLLGQDVKNLVNTIDSLKTREVNATNSLLELRNKIEKLLEAKKLALESAKNQDFGEVVDILNDQIAILEYLV
jgi:ElaB/YqjD/DUF883 family membrane-anchored ribosome-binding protein